MKNVIRILVCLLVVWACTSCISAAAVSHSKKQVNNLDKKTVTLTGKTFQRINRHSVLMVTDKNDVVCIITDFEDYHNGMTIKGRFRRLGTYEYLAFDRRIHHVPIFVLKKDYRKYKIIAEELGAKKVMSPGKRQADPKIAI